MANQHTAYSADELAWLRAHYATAPRAEVLAAVPNRTWSNIRNQAYKMRVTGRAKFLPVNKVTSWGPENRAALLAHYPLGGSILVAGLTGLTRTAVRSEANRQGLHYAGLNQRPQAPKAPRPLPAPRVAAAPRPKAVAAPKPAPVLSAKRGTGTTNLDQAKAARKHREKPRTGLIEAIARYKTLHYGEPEHTAFRDGGLLGWQQWNTQQNLQPLS